MTDRLREAAQAALDAWEAFDSTTCIETTSKAFEDLRGALAEKTEDWDRVTALEESLREHMAEIHRLRAALAEQDAEPVFCTYCGGNDEDPQDHCVDCTSPEAPIAEVVDDGNGYPVIEWRGDQSSFYDRHPTGTKFFTHPPRREWVGLTDEEIAKAIRPVCSLENDAVLSSLIDLSMDEYRAIEAALKEKNRDH